MPVLITNHGAHSAEKWADTTAQMIFPVDPNVEGERLLQARRVQLKVAEALEPHHSRTQSQEREHLGSDPDRRMVVGMHDTLDPAKEALQGVIDALKGTPWESKADSEEWRNIVTNTIAQHMADQQHIERRIFADRNPDHGAARAYKMHFDHAHGVPLEHLEEDERQVLIEQGPNALAEHQQRKLAPQG